MEISPESTTTLCSHCERDIPSSNIDLHYVHCSRNLQKCTICREMVPKKHSNEHYNEAHAPVECTLCNETVEREVWSSHKGEQCPQRMITCEYCEFPLPAVDLFKHQEICGNRTELCYRCNKYVRLRERDNHDIQFHGDSNDESNNTAESYRDGRGPVREEGAYRRQPRDSPNKRILFTIALSGIAVLVGSFFMQRRIDTQQEQ
ncbi:uncharacterized protein A4U43_C09F9740 [Asparagus officinalis]|uniref:TRAFD1/XAF1 zinc finger domain-containing protein n=1 Tax=Asparagus officinalis TaxID=4686 RepID=A0A5P1E9N1_ASPOF|nr:TRAF-type zinc finger domain-containing protein 1 [Asparagus officinalis]ONK58215.1 uncharacterized protein A4U43_C09F9740 [Asparagus officinalis]